jgi:hypothetical protein
MSMNGTGTGTETENGVNITANDVPSLIRGQPGIRAIITVILGGTVCSLSSVRSELED